MEEKLINVGIFWAFPTKVDGVWDFCEAKKSYPKSSANALRFIEYPYTHYEKWDDVASSVEPHDCDYYPRGRVIYDTNLNRHLIFADECLDEFCLQDIAELFGAENFILCRDEHYVSEFTKKHNAEKTAKQSLSYNVLRGKDKIGETIIEIAYGANRILVELGKSLEGGDELFEHQLLKKHYSAVIISHYHEDHAGLIYRKYDCPVFVGEGAYRVLNAMSAYRCIELPKNIETYRNAKSFKIGGIKITPFLCDHSAYDSYMLLFEAGGKSILYTGDFRFHGRKDRDKLLSALPEAVDILIHEGTNIGKNCEIISESELENKAVEIMKSMQGPVFVLQSSSNIDRLVSIYRASRKSGRITYMDNYTSQIAISAGGHIPRPDAFIDVIAFTPRPVYGQRRASFMEIQNKRRLDAIANGTKKFTMFVRQSMTNYLKKLISQAHIQGATLIYSIWKGYKELEYTARFLEEMSALGMRIIDLHTSGHASEKDIELLKQRVKAKQTVCVHTENPV